MIEGREFDTCIREDQCDIRHAPHLDTPRKYLTVLVLLVSLSPIVFEDKDMYNDDKDGTKTNT